MIMGTLCYVISDGKILMIRKKKGLGAGRLNGAGGKIETGEPPLLAAAREMAEETGVTPLDPRHVGTIAFYYGQDELPDWLVHVFVASKFTGDATATEEADPVWCKLDALDYDEMWPDDRYWLPHLIAGKRFMGKFFFDKEMKTILKHDIKMIDDAPLL